MTKTKFPFNQLFTLAFLTMMSITSFASDDSISRQKFNSESISETRSNVTPWLLDLGDDYSCRSAQRFYDGSLTLEGSLTQTITACASGELKQLHINGAMTAQGTNGNVIKLNLIDARKNIVGQSAVVWQPSMDHLQFDFTSTAVRAGEEYKIEITAALGSTVEFSTVSDRHYFTGSLKLNGVLERKNLCFIGLINEHAVELDDGDVDHNIYDEWEPYGHDFHVKPPSEVEELRHRVYPNPFVADFRVDLDTDAKVPGTVTLYNFMGKKVFEHQIEEMSDSPFIKINPQTVLKKGYYTLRIEYGDNIILDTVLKE